MNYCIIIKYLTHNIYIYILNNKLSLHKITYKSHKKLKHLYNKINVKVI